MANKGLKSYTKQVTGSVGSIGYNVNVNNNDSNLILTIPLLSSGGVNPIGLSLIYNHQNRNDVSKFGSGIVTNYDTKLIELSGIVNVHNADGSVDNFVLDENTGDYFCSETEMHITKEIISVNGDSDEIYYYMTDRYGNRAKFNPNVTVDMTEIQYVNGFKIYYYPESGVILDNGNDTKATYTLNSSGNINQIFCLENEIEQYRITFMINVTTNKLMKIIKSYAGSVIESYDFEFEDNYIRVYDGEKEYGVLFTLSSNKVTRIEEEFYAYVEQDDSTYEIEIVDSNLLYNFSYFNGESVITNKLGDTLTIVYDHDLPTLEYDNKNNVRVTNFNNKNQLIYSSNVMNMNRLMAKGQKLLTPTGGTDLYYSVSGSTGLANTFGFTQTREIRNQSEGIEGEDVYEIEFEGMENEPVSLITFVEQKTVCCDGAGGSIIAVLYSDDEIVGSKIHNIFNDVADNDAKMIVLGIVPKKQYNKVKVYVRSLDVTIAYNDLILCKNDFGTYYTYETNSLNLISIITSSNKKILGYSNNYIESEVVKGNKEKTYKYDDKKNPLKTVNCYGVKTTNEYDEDTNELIKKTITSEVNGSINVDYTYDNGDLTKETDSTGNTVDYIYDNYHREDITTANSIKNDVTYSGNDISKIEVSTSSSVKIADIDYQYDDKKNIKTITCENGSVYDFTYDVRNRLTKVTLNGARVLELSYDSNDNLIQKKYGDNNYFAFEYTNQLLQQIKYGSSLKFTLLYDDYERIKSITNILTNITTSYEFDDYDRLCKVTEGNSSIEYKYNEADNDVNIVRNIEGFKVIEAHNNLVQTNVSSANKLRGLFNENKRYVGSMCINDAHLRGNYDNKTYLYPSSVDEELLVIYNEIHCINLATTDARSFVIKSPNDNNAGSIGFWFDVTSSGVVPLLIVGNDALNECLVVQHENGALKLKYYDGEDFETLKTMNKNLDTGFNFFGFVWSVSDSSIDYVLKLNDSVLTGSISKTNTLIFDNEYFYLCQNGSDQFNGYVAGLMMSIDGKLTADEIEEYYKLTKMYLINDPQRDLRDNSVDYQVSSIYSELSGYEIYPLHGNANSLSGKKPNKYNLVKTNIHDKASCYNYNMLNRRYCFEACGNSIKYNFGHTSSGTISMMVYPYNRSEIQYLFEGYDASNNRVSVFIDSDNKVNVKVGNVTNNTGFVITKNAWNYIGFSYSPNISSATNIRIVVNSNITSSTINSGVTLGTITTIVGSNKENTLPLYGQIEMLATSSSIKSTSQLETLRDSLKVVSKTNEIDDLGRLIRYGVSVNGENIISNSIQYKTNNSSPTTKVSAETILKTSSKTTLTTRAYSYEYDEEEGENDDDSDSFNDTWLNDKDSIKKITDAIFGNKKYRYNNRGFLTNDNGTTITYDSNGNIKTYGTKSFTYDSSIKDRLMSVNGNSIYYNTVNPLLPQSYKDMSFTYEGTRLTGITINYDNETTIYYDYYYNHQGLRVKKVETYEYTDDRDPVSATTLYFYDGNKLITEYRSDNDRIDFLYDTNGLLYGFINNKTDRYYYVRDVLQNILGIVDNAGNLIVKYNYTAYGELISITGNTQLALRNPFRWKGYYHDSETDWFYCQSRYYVPEWCRWLTPDKVDYLESDNINGVNLYCYCGNNPILNVDYTGCFFITLTASTIAYLALALTATAATIAVIEVEKETHFIENGLTVIFEGIEDGLESIGDFLESMFTTQNGSNVSSAVNFSVNEFEFDYVGVNVLYYERKKAAPRIRSKSKKLAREKAFLKGGKKKPVFHNGKHGPHFHPDDPKFEHWHYYFIIWILIRIFKEF